MEPDCRDSTRMQQKRKQMVFLFGMAPGKSRPDARPTIGLPDIAGQGMESRDEGLESGAGVPSRARFLAEIGRAL